MPYFKELGWRWIRSRGPRGEGAGFAEKRLPANSIRARVAEAFARLSAHVARVLDAHFAHAAPAAGAIGRADARSPQRAFAGSGTATSDVVCRQARLARAIAGILSIFFDEFATSDGRREIA